MVAFFDFPNADPIDLKMLVCIRIEWGKRTIRNLFARFGSDTRPLLWGKSDTRQRESFLRAPPADAVRSGYSLDLLGNLFGRRRVDRNLAGHVVGAIEVRGHGQISPLVEFMTHGEASRFKGYFIAFVVPRIEQH
jgi:hypothetical protein